jgi:2-phosphosulfolactate phosphatase
VAQLAPLCDVVVIVDVLSFSTCVDIAVSRGAVIYPFAGPGERAAAYAAEHGAQLAGGKRSASRYTLSPRSLMDILPGTRLVLPSLNGSTLSLGAGDTPVFTACLRNYQAVAAAVQKVGRRTAVIPAGERWGDGSLRPALEDWLGAGAVISQLSGSLSPESRAALAAFHEARSQIEAVLCQTPSGQELIERGFEEDVRLAAHQNASACAPRLIDYAYRCSND